MIRSFVWFVTLLLAPALTAQTELRIGGYAQVDGRWISDDRPDDASTFLIRRARLIFSGRLAKIVTFRVMPDFGSGRTSLEDCYVEAQATTRLAIRGGKFKVPFGQERLLSAVDLPLAERSLANNLAPNRDVGLMVSTKVWKDRMTIDAGLFNGASDGASVDSDSDNGKEAAARITAEILPKRLRAALAATHGDSDGPAAVSYRTPAQETFFTYLSGTAGNGARSRFSPQIAFTSTALYVSAEASMSRQKIRRGERSLEASNRAWQVTGRWVSHGTIDLAGKVTPSAAGAWELVARAGDLQVDDDVFSGFADPATSASSARSAGAGVNWYPSAPLKLMLGIERTSFDGNGRGDETFVGLRMQVAF